MLVGMMRFKKDPPVDFFSLLTMVSNYNGVELIYLSPHSFNSNKKKVKGKMLINGDIITVERELPSFIEISPYFFSDRNKVKYKDIINFLKENTELSIDRRNIIKKDELQTFLSKSKNFSHMAIPFEAVINYSQFIRYLEAHNKIVV